MKMLKYVFLPKLTCFGFFARAHRKNGLNLDQNRKSWKNTRTEGACWVIVSSVVEIFYITGYDPIWYRLSTAPQFYVR